MSRRQAEAGRAEPEGWWGANRGGKLRPGPALRSAPQAPMQAPPPAPTGSDAAGRAGAAEVFLPSASDRQTLLTDICRGCEYREALWRYRRI
jgi:hypothetical protein